MRPLRVLVVDDDEIVCAQLQRLLAARGHRASTFTAPRIALPTVRNEQFDLVLLDVKMPGMDGVEALQAMRPLLPRATFVMITASSADDRVGDAFGEGATLCLAKPFDAEALDQLLSFFAPAPARA